MVYRFFCRDCRAYRYGNETEVSVCESCGSASVRKDRLAASARTDSKSKRPRGCGCRRRG